MHARGHLHPRYPIALEPVDAQVDQAAQATSKSAVSRRFVNATAERLAELHSRPLGDQRWLIVYLDEPPDAFDVIINAAR